MDVRNPQRQGAAMARESWDLPDLWDRLQWVLDHRADVIGGQGTAWARKAGLKGRNHVNVAIHRKTKWMAGELLAKLAIAAQVSTDWLASNRGSPLEAAPRGRADDPYRKRAIAVARREQDPLVSPRAISAAQALAGETFRTWPVARWTRLIERLSLADARGNQDAFAALLDQARGATRPPPSPPSTDRARRAS